MYSQTIKWCAASGAIAFTALAAMQPGWAQDAQNAPSLTQRPTSEVDNPYAARTYVVNENTYLVDPRRPAAMAEIRKAAEELRDAKEDQAKETAELHLRDLLLKYFAADMEKRAKELDAMNRRLQKLNEQLQRRQTKMDEIIDLQMKVLANEAAGLGFFTSAPAPVGLPSAPNPYFYYAPNATAAEPILPPSAARTPAVPIPTEREETIAPSRPARIIPDSR